MLDNVNYKNTIIVFRQIFCGILSITTAEMKTKKTIAWELNHLISEQHVILGHLTEHAGRLWNKANCLVKNRLAKLDYRNLYNKLKDTSLHLFSLQSSSVQIVLNELSMAWCNFFRVLENPERFKNKGIEIVKPPNSCSSVLCKGISCLPV